MLSPRSRGKGSRRGPWREGGRGKQRPVSWRKQAVHAVAALPKEIGEIVELNLSRPSGLSPAECIYLFDQRMSRFGIHYEAELHGRGYHSYFMIRAPARNEAEVRGAIAQIQQR